MKKKLALAAAALALAAGSAFAQEVPCRMEATGKRLAGAAFDSFMKKCEGQAQKACETSAEDKRLVGAARSAFLRKCLLDAIGT